MQYLGRLGDNGGGGVGVDGNHCMQLPAHFDFLLTDDDTTNLFTDTIQRLLDPTHMSWGPA